MEKPRKPRKLITVTLKPAMLDAVDALAVKERRTLAAMTALLVEEALASRAKGGAQ